MAIEKILKIEGASITWTCKQIVKMIEKDTEQLHSYIFIYYNLFSQEFPP